MKKPRITVLFDTDEPLPKGFDFERPLASSDEVEYDVARTLRDLEYPFDLLPFHDDPAALVAELQRLQPEIVFNLTESFRRVSRLDYAVAGLLEMLSLPYTGSAPFGLLLARDKAVTKKMLAFHGVRVPHFTVFPCGVKKQRPSDLRFPLIVKPLQEDASLGIAQSSVVRDDRSLEERVTFIQESLKNDAIVEELIVGREIYLAVLGNDPPRALSPIEMVFQKEEVEELKIATFRAKWNAKYRKAKGIENVLAKDLTEEETERIVHAGLTAFSALQLRDYARIDLRVTPDHEVYVIEANPNPFIAVNEDVPLAASGAGIAYPELIERIAKCAAARKKNGA